MREFLTKSPQETEALGEEIAQEVSIGAIVLLFGELGTGKTTLARGICRSLQISSQVKSPSFIIVNTYSGKVTVYHIDLYRIRESNPTLTGELLEYIWDKDAIKIVEWAERIPGEIVPKNAIKITLERISKSERKITIFEDKAQ